MKLERQYVRELIKVLAADLEGAVVLKHSDQVTSGIPDVSVTWSGLTFWIEVKRGSAIKARGIQVLTAMRLAKQGHCFFVLYDEDNTYIIKPQQIKTRVIEIETTYIGTDPGRHHMVARYIRSLLDDHYKT